MASDINTQLSRLKNRRSGTDRIANVAMDARDAIWAKSLIDEEWEKKASQKPNTRYAIGAMQPVDATYTKVSLETASRIQNQLEKRLPAHGVKSVYRLQGSVPLDVHIRGVSDVDLLAIDTSLLSYQLGGKLSNIGYYVPSPKSSKEVISLLRDSCAKSLVDAFPATDIVVGDKSIKISGGSLPRPVDVVPSHWWDTLKYQDTLVEDYRGVIISNKATNETIQNQPFYHIRLIQERCASVQGSLRKAIRLCKNIKADSEEDGEEIELSSFDIASAMYHANLDMLRIGLIYDLAILAETQRHLDSLATNHLYAKTLLVPDGSRPIFNDNRKLAALNQLSIKVDKLLLNVAKEYDPRLNLLSTSTHEANRNTVRSIFVI